MAGLKSIELWGGAATISMPEHMIDASDIRPVPDNQEVPALQMIAQIFARQIAHTREQFDPCGIFSEDNYTHDSQLRSHHLYWTEDKPV